MKCLHLCLLKRQVFSCSHMVIWYKYVLMRLMVWTLAFSTIEYLKGFASLSMYCWLLLLYLGYSIRGHGPLSFIYIGLVHYCIGCCYCNYCYCIYCCDCESYPYNFYVRGFRRLFGQCLAVRLPLCINLQILIRPHS